MRNNSRYSVLLVTLHFLIEGEAMYAVTTYGCLERGNEHATTHNYTG